jgi:hypothetical protein
MSLKFVEFTEVIIFCYVQNCLCDDQFGGELAP